MELTATLRDSDENFLAKKEKKRLLGRVVIKVHRIIIKSLEIYLDKGIYAGNSLRRWFLRPKFGVRLKQAIASNFHKE